jgi:hypothetical protein
VTMSRGYWATFVDCHFDASCSKSKAEAVEAVGVRRSRGRAHDDLSVDTPEG